MLVEAPSLTDVNEGKQDKSKGEKMKEYQPIEELLPSADWSIYRLVRMAAKRALELSDGRKCLVGNPGSDKFTTQALEEIRQNKVECKQVADRREHPKKKQPKPEEQEEHALN